MRRTTLLPLAAASIMALTSLSTGSESRKPLPLPEYYDESVNLLGHRVGDEIYHAPRASARFCENLLENGTPEDIAVVEKMIPGILSGQITDPEHPHYGAFKWELEMQAVEDFNAVQFLLFSLIPITVEHADKLHPDTVERLRDSIRLGLINIRKVDVGLEYTNIVLKDIANSCLGGELLGDTPFAERGHAKMVRWMEFTDRSGGPFEYNSLPYTAVAIEVLSRLERLVKHEPTRVRAKIMLSRLALSAGLHVHSPTGRWAGPHSRAYHGSVIGETGAYLLGELEANSFRSWTESGKVPHWLGALVEQEVLPDEIAETTGLKSGVSISTYKAPTYSLGVASRNASNQRNRYIAWQSNVFTLHYQRPGEDRPGSLYTRYILDDKWLGYFSPGIGRPTGGLLPDVGHFQGVQDRERAIGLYVPQDMSAESHHSGAKAVVAIPRWNHEKDAVWVGESEVKSFPHRVADGKTIVFESGSIMSGFKPLTLTNLGTESQIFIIEKDDTLVLEMINYRGPMKTFWELSWPGAFFQGLPQCGFYSEVVDRDTYESGAAFAAVIDSGKVIDTAAPPFTYTGTEARPWRVEYQRDGRKLGIEVDLMDWFRPVRRWNHEGEIGWPMLESARAKQTATGIVSVGDAKLRCGASQPAWLYASPSGTTAAAAYHGPETASVVLELPEGRVELESAESALIAWTPEGVVIDAIGLRGEPKIEGNTLIGR